MTSCRFNCWFSQSPTKPWQRWHRHQGQRIGSAGVVCVRSVKCAIVKRNTARCASHCHRALPVIIHRSQISIPLKRTVRGGLVADDWDCALQGDDKQRFNEIAEELSKLTTKFSNNILDGTPRYPGVPPRSTLTAIQQSPAQEPAPATSCQLHDHMPGMVAV